MLYEITFEQTRVSLQVWGCFRNINYTVYLCVYIYIYYLSISYVVFYITLAINDIMEYHELRLDTSALQDRLASIVVEQVQLESFQSKPDSMLESSSGKRRKLWKRSRRRKQQLPKKSSEALEDPSFVAMKSLQYQ